MSLHARNVKTVSRWSGVEEARRAWWYCLRSGPHTQPSSKP